MTAGSRHFRINNAATNTPAVRSNPVMLCALGVTRIELLLVTATPKCIRVDTHAIAAAIQVESQTGRRPRTSSRTVTNDVTSPRIVTGAILNAGDLSVPSSITSAEAMNGATVSSVEGQLAILWRLTAAPQFQMASPYALRLSLPEAYRVAFPPFSGISSFTPQAPAF